MPEHDPWFAIAHDDLNFAKYAVKGGFFSSSAYHCQQAAEKFLKGYLAFKNQPIMKTHDLTKLVIQCKKLDIEFEKVYSTAEALNPFSTRFRYPTEFEIPDLADAQEAVKHASAIMHFVLKKIGVPESGQSHIFDKS